MLYAVVRSPDRADRILLFPTRDAARSAIGRDAPIRPVAVAHDAANRRVIPLVVDPSRIDPAWTAPAEAHPDGSVTARGPLPPGLFEV